MMDWLYGEVVKDHFLNPRNALYSDTADWDASADGIGTVGSPVCGDMMRVWIKVDRDSGRIRDLRWKTFGCASAIASTSMMSEVVLEDGGMTLEQARALTPRDILRKLGGLPEHKIHCSVLGDKALRAAINDYYTRIGMSEKVIDKPSAVICECLQVTDNDIEEAVLEGVRDFAGLQNRTKAGTACTKCHDSLKRILGEYMAKYFSADAEDAVQF
ncbi:MAG: iron-sulfur cluster assembly scaffold protein [bacterium]